MFLFHTVTEWLRGWTSKVTLFKLRGFESPRCRYSRKALQGWPSWDEPMEFTNSRSAIGSRNSGRVGRKSDLASGATSVTRAGSGWPHQKKTKKNNRRFCCRCASKCLGAMGPPLPPSPPNLPTCTRSTFSGLRGNVHPLRPNPYLEQQFRHRDSNPVRSGESRVS